MASQMDWIRQRHSVRQYLDKPIPQELRESLDACAEELNQAGGLHIQIFYDEPACFSSRLAHYGRSGTSPRFKAVRTSILCRNSAKWVD